jgi:hypothetical protein
LPIAKEKPENPIETYIEILLEESKQHDPLETRNMDRERL